jgi:acyl carrier protein
LGDDTSGANTPLNSAVASLLTFVNEDLLAGSKDKIAPDTPLFDEGWIDSLKILRLIAFLELRSGKKIPDELIVMDRFRTVETIAKNFPDR